MNRFDGAYLVLSPTQRTTEAGTTLFAGMYNLKVSAGKAVDIARVLADGHVSRTVGIVNHCGKPLVDGQLDCRLWTESDEALSAWNPTEDDAAEEVSPTRPSSPEGNPDADAAQEDGSEYDEAEDKTELPRDPRAVEPCHARDHGRARPASDRPKFSAHKPPYCCMTLASTPWRGGPRVRHAAAVYDEPPTVRVRPSDNW